MKLANWKDYRGSFAYGFWHNGLFYGLFYQQPKLESESITFTIPKIGPKLFIGSNPYDRINNG